MSIVMCPTNVRFPTYGEGARAAYVNGQIDIDDYELAVEWLLRDDQFDKSMGLHVGGLPPAQPRPRPVVLASRTGTATWCREDEYPPLPTPETPDPGTAMRW